MVSPWQLRHPSTLLVGRLQHNQLYQFIQSTLHLALLPLDLRLIWPPLVLRALERTHRGIPTTGCVAYPCTPCIIERPYQLPVFFDCHRRIFTPKNFHRREEDDEPVRLIWRGGTMTISNCAKLKGSKQATLETQEQASKLVPQEQASIAVN